MQGILCPGQLRTGAGQLQSGPGGRRDKKPVPWLIQRHEEALQLMVPIVPATEDAQKDIGLTSGLKNGAWGHKEDILIFRNTRFQPCRAKARMKLDFAFSVTPA
jgi:hypothetical protein